MEYRDANYDDYESFIALAEKTHKQSIYKNLNFSEKKAFTRFASFLENKNRYFCKVAVCNDKVVGVLFGKLVKPDYSDDFIACDVFFWVERSIRKQGIGLALIELFLGWALAGRAKHIQLQNGAGIIGDLSGLFKKAGLVKTGELYGTK